MATRVERKLNMSWNDPNLCFFLFLLAGFATFLAIIYECTQRFRRRSPEIWPLILSSPGRPTEERAGGQLSDFSRLCESVEDLPPKEQARQARDYFGTFGGGRRRATRTATAVADIALEWFDPKDSASGIARCAKSATWHMKPGTIEP